MKLIHSGKVLKDDQTLADCNIKPNAFLVVMISKAKKKAPVAAPAAATPAPAAAPAQDTTATPAAPATTTTTTTSTSETPAPAPAASETTSTPAPAAAAAPPAPADDLSAESVASLIAMGFPEAEVRACLRAAQGNADVAVEFLMSGIPDYAQAAASGAGGATAPSAATATAATPASSSAASSSAEPLAQLRNHSQINDLRRLVQGNPSTLQAVLTQIGEQQPELLQEINGNQELFLQIMNEPVSESSGSGSF